MVGLVDGGRESVAVVTIRGMSEGGCIIQRVGLFPRRPSSQTLCWGHIRSCCGRPPPTRALKKINLIYAAKGQRRLQ